ncbi:MAG: carbamoyl phosphate synthase small subunit, partial [Clostridia bacterium]|nr:carbamoyl phosphate synthase small subunit [Clostridia bacterium]
MVTRHDRKITLEDGSVYTGIGFGSRVTKVNEIVFNTSMVGYQEIVSDPSYTYQMVVMTYPLIGNYGITDEDFETRTPTIGGLIVREYNDLPSNFRYTRTLSEIMEENDIPGIYDVDTREITRSIRDLGSRKVLISDIDVPHEEC